MVHVWQYTDMNFLVATILRSWDIHSIKRDIHGNQKKRCLVGIGHIDPEKGYVVNETPTLAEIIS